MVLKLGTLAFFGAGDLVACGPDFPNRYLDLSAQAMLAAPEGFFALEMERLAPAPKRTAAIEESKEDRRGENDLREALCRRGDANGPAEKIVESCRTYRVHQRRWSEGDHAEKLGAVPADLPREFAYYLAGATAWYENNFDLASIEWRAVLALPAEERRYRSTWAAYMLGRNAARNGKRDEASRWFAMVRCLAQSGFADSLNLVGASFGVEAQSALALRDYGRAIGLYLDQYATGDESAYISLRMAAAAAASGDGKQQRELARDSRARPVVTAWFLARFIFNDDAEVSSLPLRTWTTALVNAQIKDVEHADRMAWLAYEAGDFDLARNWAGLALDISPETHWIRGKLALHDNRLCEGAEELGLAARSPSLPAIYRSVILGELGRVQLALDRREAALTAWMDGAHWEDAAYVAERLLTIDELKAFQTSYRPAAWPLYEPYFGEVVTPQTLDSSRSGRTTSEAESASTLRTQLAELLARRLVRAGRVKEADNYFNEKNRLALRAYATDVQAGFNLMLSPKKRAQAFWRAARLVHEEGMTLMGAELDPDFGIWGGSFSNGGVADVRKKMDAGPFSATKEESECLAKIAIPAKRFSYRYRAADLAWWAASLLPNDHDETAAILNTAGGWLKNRDPVEANRFYQALVIRCGRTELGRIAVQKHWFPPDE